ncbi:MAG TPA: hypothetical protein VJ617_00030 [Arthrobacter sp.]|nr:hypothetical protein [Arthrobacter sp.]
MSFLTQMPCDDCGEIGRPKESVSVMDVLAYFCHDEEKSCYNYRVRVELDKLMKMMGVTK